MDGIATLQEIRRLHLALPVIILTGHGGFHDAVAGIQLEIVDFLQKPVDVEKLGFRIRKLPTVGGQRPLCERTVNELMVSATSYQRILAHEPVARAVSAVQESFFHRVSGKLAEQGHRTVLVYDHEGRLRGLIRISDIIRLAVPAFLRGSPYSSYFTGMFLAHRKTLGSLTVGDLLEPQPTITEGMPFMEAAHLMTTHRMINLAVIRGDELLGILRDKDLLLEVASLLVAD